MKLEKLEQVEQAGGRHLEGKARAGGRFMYLNIDSAGEAATTAALETPTARAE